MKETKATKIEKYDAGADKIGAAPSASAEPLFMVSTDARDGPITLMQDNEASVVLIRLPSPSG